MRRHVAAHYGTGPYHCPFTDSNVRQDDTVRTYEDILFNYDFSIAGGSSWTRVKVGDYRRSKADGAVVTDRHVGRMYFIDVHELTNPDIPSHLNSAQPL
jgi:hypothetical protein